jgi:hypothetical protein
LRNSEPNMYGALATIRNGYMQMQWSRVQMYLVFNTVALPLVFHTETEPTTRLIVGVVGIIVTIFMPIALVRGNYWSKYFSNKMAELEALDPEDDRCPRVTVFNDDQYRSFKKKRYATRKLFAPVAVILLAIWIWVTTRQGMALLVQAGYLQMSN